MSVHTYDGLAGHRGHEIECVTYADQNAALECVTCGTVLVNFDADPADPTTTEKAMMVRQLLEEITNESDGPTRTLASRMLREDAYTLSEWVRLDAESRARRAKWRVIP